MIHSDTEVLFPPRLIASLRNLRGKPWQDLVDQTAAQEVTAVDRVAFVLLMVRLTGCQSCHADSYRGLRGCSVCASQTIRNFRGSDQDLVKLFMNARQEVDRFLGSETAPR